MDMGMNFSHGFFIEAGAFDGLSGSNTLLFERQLCWKGLLFEPSDRYFGIADKWGGGGGPSARPESLFINAAIVDSAHNKLEMYAGIDNEPTNSVPQSEEAQAAIKAVQPNAKKVFGYSVAHMLREMKVGPRGVDFFSLDIEGYELQALNGLEEFRPSLIMMELWYRNTVAVDEKMRELGYTQLYPPSAIWTKASAIFSDTLWRYTAGP